MQLINKGEKYIARIRKLNLICTIILVSLLMKGKVISFLVLCVLLISCGPGKNTLQSEVVGQGTDLPMAFQASEGVQLSTSSCKSPMKDPRDGTEIQMIRSSNSHADYQVPPGKYGVGDRELLRLNCATGEVIGVVKR